MNARRGIQRALTALGLVGCMAGGVAAQEETPPIPTELPSLAGRPSPVGAMVRSFVLPGWGQASYDRYVRGGVYFMGHTGNLFMVFKTLTSLDEAREREDRIVAASEDRLLESGTPPDSLDAEVDVDASVVSIRRLVSAREEQREDWIALGLFWLLISGVDAYVTAQLADFPASIGATTDGRSVGIMVTVPVR
ncbi:MAG TPA: DUF5683 domain-containing protein [Longimicrobiales bacterium]|nr:DUF5683 domain-containing protein [Longimicrobiales bacterium]